MKFPCACRACGHDNDVEWSQIGQSLACVGCGQPMKVLPPMETVEGGAREPAPSRVRFLCPACGRKYATKPDMAGKKIRCSGCGAGVRVPTESEAPVKAPARPVLKTFGAPDPSPSPTPTDHDRTAPAVTHASSDDIAADSSLLEELATVEGGERRKRSESVLPSRSEAMEQVRQKVAEQEAIDTKKQAEKAKKKKRKKKSGYFNPKDTLILVGSALGLVILLALIAWGYPDFRFPLGGVLCIIGFIVYLLGLAALRQLVAEEGPFQALLFRFFPPYQWWFVATHWAETKDYVAFFGAGLIILSIGGFVIKSSPVGKLAEESERAYQKAQQGP